MLRRTTTMVEKKRQSGCEDGEAAPASRAGKKTPAVKRRAAAVNDAGQLPADMRELAERMLVEGATFEDVQDSLNERGVSVTLQAVQNLYRGNLELQKRRIQFQVERAQALKEALANPGSVDAELAYAAMLTGLQRLERKDGGLTLRDAIRGTLERRNIQLRRKLLNMQIEREIEERKFRRTRLHAEIAKLQLTRTKLAQLQEELKRQKGGATLGPAAMEKIQEIYGLLQIPVVPRDVEPVGKVDEE
jgi:hypothetical protein